MIILLASGAKNRGVLGAALLSSSKAPLPPCAAEVLGSVAYHLQRGLRQVASESVLSARSALKS